MKGDYVQVKLKNVPHYGKLIAVGPERSTIQYTNGGKVYEFGNSRFTVVKKK